MQSGIKASAELQSAFKAFLSDTSQRGLLASISSETLVPAETIPSTSPDFTSDLANVAPLLKDNAAAYIILRQHGDTGSSNAAGNCVAVTYVPDHAPVRQKMLFASTRLSLVRELGTEHFVSTLFATTKAELTAEGWAKHEAHGSLSAPLTEEEQNLAGIREAEAKESMGTTVRRGGHLNNANNLPLEDDALEALAKLKTGELALVQLQINVGAERLLLASTSPAPLAPSALSSTISSTSPRHSFYAYSSSTGSIPTILFISSCPSGASIKERMMHASSRTGVMTSTAAEAGLEIAGKMEVSNPDEIAEDDVTKEVGGKAQSAGSETASANAPLASGQEKLFSRPKRPGRK